MRQWVAIIAAKTLCKARPAPIVICLNCGGTNRQRTDGQNLTLIESRTVEDASVQDCGIVSPIPLATDFAEWKHVFEQASPNRHARAVDALRDLLGRLT